MTPSPARQADAPIGIFDSGLGGLTVVRRVREALPQERVLYVADQAHVPYGGRDLAEVCGFACGIGEALLAQGCKAVVMACNISSATALDVVAAAHPGIPILGVIRPGAQEAAAKTQNRRIGVLATEGTVKSGAYTRTLHALDPALQVTEIACPAFVPLVESGRETSAEAHQATRAYMAPLLAAEVDTVILGCTHYPFLLPVLREFSPSLTFIDPAEQTARALSAALANGGIFRSTDADAVRHLLLTTGDAGLFAAQTCRFIPDVAECADVAGAQWQSGKLLLA